MTATDFALYHSVYDPPQWLTIDTVNPIAQKDALRQIIRDYPGVSVIRIMCWYEGTLPEPVTQVTPLVIRRR